MEAIAMYLDTTVEIPVNNSKVTIKKGIYVMYEIDRKYNKAKGYTIPVRVTVGKVCQKDKTRMYPKDNINIYLPEIELSNLKANSSRSSSIKIGNYMVMKYLFSKCQINELIDNVFEDRAGIIKDLISYSIIEESNVMHYYEDYAWDHALFTSNMNIYSDSYISNLFNSLITKDEINLFMNSYNSIKNKNNPVYISYDSTNFNCQAMDIEFAEYGNAKDNPDKPIVNLSVGYDIKNSEPLFYEEYPGSINDISELSSMIDMAKGYGYKDIGFILDRGYFSRDNIRKLTETGYKFVIAAKGSAKFLRRLMSNAIDDFKPDRSNYMSEHEVYGTTIKKMVFAGIKEMSVNIYFNELKAAAEKINLEHDISKMERKYRDNINKKIKFNDNEFFKFIYDEEGTLKDYKLNYELIEERRKMAGYFCIISSEENMEYKEALDLYKSRDVSEKLFRSDKTFLGGDAMRVQSDSSLMSKTFINFLALVVRNKMYRLIKDEVYETLNTANYMNVPKAIKELDKIEITRHTDGIYRLQCAVSKTQKDILKAFDMGQGNVTMTAETLQNIIPRL